MNPPKNHCNALGNWDMRSGDCLCAAGYTPNNDYTQCVGKYTLVIPYFGSKLKTSYEIDAILI